MIKKIFIKKFEQSLRLYFIKNNNFARKNVAYKP